MFLIIPFIPLIAAGLTAGGALGGAALARGGSRRAIREQNEYNHPKNQLQRIREAGLPAAAMFGGAHAGNQSVVAESESGVGEAIRGGIDSYISTTMQKKQLELMQAQIEATKAGKEKTLQEAQHILNRNVLDNLDPTQGDPISFLARMQRFEYEAREISLFAQRNSWQMQQLESNMKADLIKDGTLSAITRNQLQSMLNALKLSDQAINRGLIMDTLVEQMKKGGIHLAEALMMAMGMGDLHSPVSFPNINIQGERNYNAQQYHDHKVDIWK